MHGGEEAYGPIIYPSWHDEVDEVELVEAMVRAHADALHDQGGCGGIANCKDCQNELAELEAQAERDEVRWAMERYRLAFLRLFDVAIALVLGGLFR